MLHQYVTHHDSSKHVLLLLLLLLQERDARHPSDKLLLRLQCGGLFCLFLMLGSIGWRASLLFVRNIYKVSQAC